MKIIIFFLLLLVPLTSLSAQELSDEEAIDLIKSKLLKIKPKLFYQNESNFFGVRDFKIHRVSIQKRGKYKKEKQYLPVRARIEGKSKITLGFNVYSQKTKNDYFDRIVDVRLAQNDFDEWETEVIKIKQTPDSIKTPELKKISKLPFISSIDQKQTTFEVIDTADLQNNDKIKSNSLVNKNSTKSIFAVRDKNNTIELHLRDLTTNKIQNLRIVSITEKCVWANDNIHVFCSVPLNAFNKETIKLWRNNKFSFRDDIFKTNTNNNSIEIVFDSLILEKEVDIVNLMVGDKGKYLYWKAKRTGDLWSYDTRYNH